MAAARTTQTAILVAAALLAFAATAKCAEPPEKTPEKRAPTAEGPREERREVTKAFLGRLGRRVSFEFDQTPLQEALTFLNSLMKVSVTSNPQDAPADGWRKLVTVRYENVALGHALSDMLAQAGLDWTIGVFPGMRADGGEKMSVVVGTPEQVKAMNDKYPEIAELVAAFRKELAQPVKAEEKREPSK
jgi:hypothetical protein